MGLVSKPRGWGDGSFRHAEKRLVIGFSLVALVLAAEIEKKEKKKKRNNRSKEKPRVVVVLSMHVCKGGWNAC